MAWRKGHGIEGEVSGIFRQVIRFNGMPMRKLVRVVVTLAGKGRVGVCAVIPVSAASCKTMIKGRRWAHR
ncbi:MAG: hypothetical protein ACYCVY_05475 [Acidiferrobacteraceae bacterium]